MPTPPRQGTWQSGTFVVDANEMPKVSVSLVRFDAALPLPRGPRSVRVEMGRLTGSASRRSIRPMHGWKRCQVFLAVAGGVFAGCGEAPEPPGAVGGPTSNVVGTGNASQMDVLPVQPGRPNPGVPTPPDAGAGENLPELPVVPAEAASSARVFAACRESRVSGCDYLHVTAQGTSPALCVQLTLDNCNEYGRGSGLTVDLPLTWQLSSGSASDAKICDLLDFDPRSLPVGSATGQISWDQRGRVISSLAIDVSLQLSVEPGSSVPARIELETSTALAAVPDCED